MKTKAVARRNIRATKPNSKQSEFRHLVVRIGFLGWCFYSTVRRGRRRRGAVGFLFNLKSKDITAAAAIRRRQCERTKEGKHRSSNERQITQSKTLINYVRESPIYIYAAENVTKYKPRISDDVHKVRLSENALM